ncbi:APC family permease [Francisella tularensis]|uniref:APC family permease n=1 Tax=Francisella tularensis TaxID=263 RepID=UPI000173E2B3|nr:APC family permease [Francisella tularensis]ACD30334.1 amino acid-polyamine-organocation family protein [Francisella tularensis subsp. mediasiatica FSC147]MBK2077666.1 APC family permease [Francisella tularensis subsp. mediasiatica]MBK2101084.1 APC family permease [Francisella tularensis subsp. mediasiatica]MBK2104877.1 APC family permease [Francisella tularensis subsp. mediasiatica]MDN9002664.1 APC family permease [Francisella tularensis subsp. mediasiatica]
MEINTSQKMSLFSAILIGVTSMVGSGWLFSAQLTAKTAGNWAFLAWVLAAIMIMMVGLCLAKVVSVFPVRGATTRSSALSHNSVFAMPFAFANWFGIVVMISTEAQATTQYLAGIKGFEWLMHNGIISTYGMLLSLFILVIYLIINFYGVKLLASVNNGITVFKMFVPAAIVIIFIIYAFTHSTEHHSLVSADIPNNNFTVGNALTAIVAGGLVYTFNGFQIVVAYSSEIKNPSRNVPLAIILSLTLVLLLYMGLQYAFMQAVPHEYLISKGGWAGLDFESPLLQVATLIGLGYIAVLLIIDSIVSPSATGYSYLGASSRMLYAMSAEGQMPRYFAKINKQVNISRRSLIANFLICAGFLIFSDNWVALMLIVTGFNIIGYMAAPISMGAIAPKTRIFGMIVFVLLTMLLNTVEVETNIHLSIILVILMSIFGIFEYRRVGFRSLVILIMPFIIFVCIISSINHTYFEGIIGAIFYLIVTDKRYVTYCKKTANQDNIVED